MRLWCLLVFVFCSVTQIAHAQESLEHLPVPRWAALASNDTNLRTGPGKRYPIDWVIRKKYLPVEVIQEFDHWRRIKEPGGADGWVNKLMLTGSRHVLLRAEDNLYTKPDTQTRIIAHLQKGVLAKLNHCQKDWCELEADQYTGWTPKKNLWGVYPDEIIE